MYTQSTFTILPAPHSAHNTILMCPSSREGKKLVLVGIARAIAWASEQRQVKNAASIVAMFV